MGAGQAEILIERGRLTIKSRGVLRENWKIDQSFLPKMVFMSY